MYPSFVVPQNKLVELFKLPKNNLRISNSETVSAGENKIKT